MEVVKLRKSKKEKDTGLLVMNVFIGQVIIVEHNGERLEFKLKRQNGTNMIKCAFYGPKTFAIERDNVKKSFLGGKNE